MTDLCFLFKILLKLIVQDSSQSSQQNNYNNNLLYVNFSSANIIMSDVMSPT